MSDIIIWILCGIALLIGYFLLQVVIETVLSVILFVLYMPFKPLFDWLIFDRPFWQEGTIWRDMNSGLRVFLIIAGAAGVIVLLIGLMHYQEFKNG